MNEKEPPRSGKLCFGDRSLCVDLLLAFRLAPHWVRFAVSQSLLKWQQQTKHNKSCKNLSTRWIHTFATRSHCPLLGPSRGILCADELGARGCRLRKFNLTTSREGNLAKHILWLSLGPGAALKTFRTSTPLARCLILLSRTLRTPAENNGADQRSCTPNMRFVPP